MKPLQNNAEATIYREFSPFSFPGAGEEGERKAVLGEEKKAP